MSLEAPTRSIKANKFQMQLYADAALLRKDITIHETARKADPNRVSEHTIKQKKYELTQIEHRIKNVNPASVTSQCEKYFAENTEFFNRDTIIAETQRMLEHGQSVNEWPHLAAVFLLDIKYIQNATVTALAATVAPVAPVVKPDDFEALVSTMPKVTISGLS